MALMVVFLPSQGVETPSDSWHLPSSPLLATFSTSNTHSCLVCSASNDPRHLSIVLTRAFSLSGVGTEILLVSRRMKMLYIIIVALAAPRNWMLNP